MVVDQATRPQTSVALGLANAADGLPLADRHWCSILPRNPNAPWMEEVALQFYVDAERSPTLIRLSGILNQGTAVNVVPVVRDLIADGGVKFELQTRSLWVLDAAGKDTLAEIQRVVQNSGGLFMWDRTTMTSDDVFPESPAGSAVGDCDVLPEDVARLLADARDELSERLSNQMDDARQAHHHAPCLSADGMPPRVRKVAL